MKKNAKSAFHNRRGFGERVTALLLALAMVPYGVPAMAFAEGDDVAPAAVEAAQDGSGLGVEGDAAADANDEQDTAQAQDIAQPDEAEQDAAAEQETAGASQGPQTAAGKTSGTRKAGSAASAAVQSEVVDGVTGGALVGDTIVMEDGGVVEGEQSHPVQVNGGTVTFKNASIDLSGTSGLSQLSAVKVAQPSTIRIEGTCTFTGAVNGAGIHIPENFEQETVISGSGEGAVLVATGNGGKSDSNSSGAGIGGIAGGKGAGTSGRIGIENLSGLSAFGMGKQASGIGSGAGGAVGAIRIANTHINEIRGGDAGTSYYQDTYGKAKFEGGSGIGGGCGSYIESITLDSCTGGNIYGGGKSAAIGEGYHAYMGVPDHHDGAITISNCVLTKIVGGCYCAGIGGGRENPNTDRACTVNISNSDLQVEGGVYGAAIGSGYDTYGIFQVGEFKAASASNPAEGVQSPIYVNIKNSAIDALGGDGSAGIGCGYKSAGVSVDIQGVYRDADGNVKGIVSKAGLPAETTSDNNGGVGKVSKTEEMLAGTDAEGHDVYVGKGGAAGIGAGAEGSGTALKVVYPDTGSISISEDAIVQAYSSGDRWAIDGFANYNGIAATVMQTRFSRNYSMKDGGSFGDVADDASEYQKYLDAQTKPDGNRFLDGRRSNSFNFGGVELSTPNGDGFKSKRGENAVLGYYSIASTVAKSNEDLKVTLTSDTQLKLNLGELVNKRYYLPQEETAAGSDDFVSGATWLSSSYGTPVTLKRAGDAAYAARSNKFKCRPGLTSFDQVAFRAVNEVEGNSSSALYDGTSHDVSKLFDTSQCVPGTTFEYSYTFEPVDGTDAGGKSSASVQADAEEWSTELPQAVNAGIYTVKLKATKEYMKDAETVSTVTISPRPVVVKTPNARKTYDGAPLQDTQAEVVDATTLQPVSEAVPGDDVSASAKGSVTDATSEDGVANEFDALVFGEGTLASNYTFNPATDVEEGRLVVDPAPLTLTAPSATKVYDGTALTARDVRNNAEGVEITSPSNGVEVAGFVNGETFEGEGSFAAEDIKDAGSTAVEPTDALDQTGGTAKLSNYKIADKIAGTLTVTPRPLTVKTPSATKVYDGTPLEATQAEVAGYVDGEQTGIHATATGTVTHVAEGAVENAFGELSFDEMFAKAANYSFDPATGVTETGTLAIEPRPLTVTAPSATKVYDGEELNPEAVAQAGTATDTSISVTNKGTVQVEEGEGTGFVEGESFAAPVTFSGSITDAGAVDSVCDDPAWDAAKADERDYALTKVNGKLIVEKRKLYLSTRSASKVYDGTPLMASEGDVAEPTASTGLVGEDSVLVIAGGSQTDATDKAGVSEDDAQGVANSYLQHTFEHGNPDNYEVADIDEGKLVVWPRHIKVTTPSDWKIYDGQAFAEGVGTVLDADSGAYLTDVVTGETLAAATRGSQSADATDAESAIPEDGAEVPSDAKGVANEFDRLVYSGDQEKFEKNYVFNEAEDVTEGKLVIYPRTIQVTTMSASKAYDGIELVQPENSVEGLVEGETLSVQNTGTQTEVGTSDNGYELVWNGTAKASNYVQLAPVIGTLTVETALADNDVPSTDTNSEETAEGTEVASAETATAETVGVGAEESYAKQDTAEEVEIGDGETATTSAVSKANSKRSSTGKANSEVTLDSQDTPLSAVDTGDRAMGLTVMLLVIACALGGAALALFMFRRRKDS